MTRSNVPTPDQKTPANAPVPADDRLRATENQYRRHILSLVEKTPMSDAQFDLSPIYPETKEIDVLREQVDDLKRCLDSFRPLGRAHLENIQGAFDVEYTYNSNGIEGNTLTLNETAMVVQHGITIGGKSMREHLEAINHQEAIAYIREIVQDDIPLTESVLKAIHGLILRGIDRENAGRYRNVPVRIQGSSHVPPQPFLVPKAMEEYFATYEAEKAETHPVILAADMHERLVTIHPFIDGNGRTARLVMNLILLRHGYVIASLSSKQELRRTYYQALETKNTTGDSAPFHRLILQTEKDGLLRYLDCMTPDIENGKGGYYLERIEPFLAKE